MRITSSDSTVNGYFLARWMGGEILLGAGQKAESTVQPEWGMGLRSFVMRSSSHYVAWAILFN